jgi:hypothetical protein
MGGMRGRDNYCKRNLTLNTWRKTPVGRQWREEEENFQLNLKEKT